jgi:ribosome maturation factor RimP
VTVERGEDLDLDAIAEVARSVSAALDEHDELAPAGPFELEVTSPGLERRLRRPEHFVRALGSIVALRTEPGTPGERRLEGRLVAADEHGVEVRPDGGNARRLAYGEIERAHTVFDWRAALAGAGSAERAEKDNRGGSAAGADSHEAAPRRGRGIEGESR